MSDSTVTARLSELGIELPPVAAPVAAYVPANRVGDLVYTSGQLPFVDGELTHKGKVRDGWMSWRRPAFHGSGPVGRSTW